MTPRINVMPTENDWITSEKYLKVLKWRDCIVTFTYAEEDDRHKKKKWSYKIEDLAGIHVDDCRFRDSESWSETFDSAMYEIGRICECRYQYGGKPVTQVLPLPDGFPTLFHDQDGDDIKPLNILFLTPEQKKPANSICHLDTRLLVEYEDGRRAILKFDSGYDSHGVALNIIDDTVIAEEIEQIKVDIGRIKRERDIRVNDKFTDRIREYVATKMTTIESPGDVEFIDFPLDITDMCDELGKSRILNIVVAVNANSPSGYDIYLRTVMTNKVCAHKGLIPLEKTVPLDEQGVYSELSQLNNKIYSLESEARKVTGLRITRMVDNLLRSSSLTSK